MNMNKYVKSLIEKYKNPSIIGEKSIEEVIDYLKQKFVIKDITQNISDIEMRYKIPCISCRRFNSKQGILSRNG